MVQIRGRPSLSVVDPVIARSLGKSTVWNREPRGNRDLRFIWSPDPEPVKPFLAEEDFSLDGIPGSLGEFLLHRRDSFIEWIKPHVPKRVADALLGLYNQTLEQLAVELEAMNECLDERFAQEMRWVKVILSLKEKIAFQETVFKQHVADHKAKIVDLKGKMDWFMESFDEETRTSRASI